MKFLGWETRNFTFRSFGFPQFFIKCVTWYEREVVKKTFTDKEIAAPTMLSDNVGIRKLLAAFL